MQQTKKKLHKINYIQTILVFVVLMIIHGSSIASNRSLYQVKGYSKFSQATSVNQSITVAYSKDSVGYISGLSVIAGEELFLHVEVPPGVTRGAKALMHANAYDGIYTTIFKASGANKNAVIPSNFSHDNFNNEPSSASGNINFYSGSVISGSNTFGTLAIKNTRGSTFRIYTLQIVYVVGPTQTDLDSYNAWVTSRAGVAGASAPSVSVSSEHVASQSTSSSTQETTNASESSISFPGSSDNTTPVNLFSVPSSDNSDNSDNSDSDNSDSDSDSDSDNTTYTFDSSTSSSTSSSTVIGKNAVFESFLVILQNNGESIISSKVKELKSSGNIFELVGEDSDYTTKFEIDLNKIPETLDNVDEESITLSSTIVKGIEERTHHLIQYKLNNSLIELELKPVLHEEGNLIAMLEAVPEIFKLISDKGWLFVILDSGVTVSLHLSLEHFDPVSNTALPIDVDVPKNYGYDSNDVNGDGIDDFMIIYDGVAQLMLIRLNG
ncbi:MAG: hypothetical protein KZQ83_07970 [gamma proteobacterium symbiont of Taylorina sp.]|nr:hypothetical protein [gamma proteobacterium symbiont of Taylorina sp.]